MVLPAARALALPLVGILVFSSCARAPRPVTMPTRVVPLDTLVPLPMSIGERAGAPFSITSETIVTTSGEDERLDFIGRYLADVIATGTQSPPAVDRSDGTVRTNAIQLRLARATQPGPESYDLVVDAAGVTITGNDPAGVFYGVQTFRQLLPVAVEHGAARPRAISAPLVAIVDAPRFAWRGAMLDVSRHFFSVADVKRLIDLLALHKLNRLHLHLSDDQGWRIEILSRPNLTAHGSRTQVGGGPGGFYTQAEYADLVAYAQQRFITIVPEIDMPGHTNAALASYPELTCDGRAPELYTGIEVGFSALCVDREETYRFIDDVVRELAALTTGDWIHVGGDEVKTLSDAQYRHFIERAQSIVHAHGKRMIGWDEIAPANLHATTIVQHWRPKTTPREAATRGARIILSPANRLYLDMKYDRSTPIGLTWAGTVDLRASYDWDPASLLEGVPEGSILGVEAPLWSETLARMSDVEFMAFPRLAAVAEIGWTPAARRSWRHFSVRLAALGRRWTALGVNFYRSPQVQW